MFSRHVKRFNLDIINSAFSSKSSSCWQALAGSSPQQDWVAVKAEFKKIESRIVSRNGFMFVSVCKRIELYRSILYQMTIYRLYTTHSVLWKVLMRTSTTTSWWLYGYKGSVNELPWFLHATHLIISELPPAILSFSGLRAAEYRPCNSLKQLIWRAKANLMITDLKTLINTSLFFSQKDSKHKRRRVFFFFVVVGMKIVLIPSSFRWDFGCECCSHELPDAKL